MWARGRLCWFPAMAGAALAVFVGAWPLLGAALQGAGELVVASGLVEVRPLGEQVWRAATLRAVLYPGDMVRTGPGGSAEVALVHGLFRMDENTVIILPPAGPAPVSPAGVSTVRLLLYKGRALFQVLKERLRGTFDVITPSVIVGVKGTIFGVEQGPGVGVVAFDDSVEVRPTGRPDAVPLMLPPGYFTVLVGNQFSPPQLYQPGVPGSIWSGGPAALQGRPLSSAPPAPAPSLTGAAQAPAAEQGSLPSPLADAGGVPTSAAAAVRTPVGPRMAPPNLAQVGGPPLAPWQVGTAGGTLGLTQVGQQGAGGLAASKGKGVGKGGCPPGQGKGKGKGGASC